MRLRNPFNPIRGLGARGAVTGEELSRVQDLLKAALDDIARQMLPVPTSSDPGTGGGPSSPSALARYWVSTADTSLPNAVDMGALGTGILHQTVALGVATPGIVTVGAGLTYVSTTLDRAALVGDVTAAAGSNTTAFRTFAARSVLANATAGIAVPTDLVAGADGDVLRRAGGTLAFGTIPASSVTGLFYQTIQNAGTPVTQRPIWNASTGLTAVDNAGATRTDVTVNLSTGIAGGQAVVGGTGSGQNLTYSSTTHGTKGLHIWGSTLGMWYDEANVRLILGTASPFSQAAVEVVKNVNSGVGFTFVNTSSGGSAYTAFFLAQNATLSSGATFGTYLFSSGSTFGLPYGVNVGLFELAGGSGNMHWWIQQNAGDFVWYTRTTFPNPPERMRVSNLGNVVIGTGLATTATDGFLYLPSSNGVPTGVPTTYSASAVIPIEVDRANNRLYAYLSPWVPIGQYTGGLATGLLKNTTGTGLWTIGVAGTDYVPPTLTLTTTAPLRIDGGASANLSANRTLSVNQFGGDGSPGYVPDPGPETGRFLKDNGSWDNPPDTGITQLTGDVTAGPGSGSQAATIANDAVTNAKLRNSVATSVIGRAGGSTGDPADIVASADNQVLWRSGGGLGFAPLDFVSFHFFIDDAAAAGVFPLGALVPSSQAPITSFGAADIPYAPGVNNIFSRGELLVYLVNNGITTGSYVVQVTLNGVSIGSASVTVTSASSGRLTASFSTGSAAASDVYEVLVSGSVGSTDTITYTAVLRLLS